MEARLYWVDYLKSIGIVAVILGHIASPFSAFIFSWHMPLFFFIAGFFLNARLSLPDFIRKDIVRLLLPYFVFALIGLGSEILKRYLLNRDSLDIGTEILGIFWHMDVTGLINTYGFVLWFLPALFFARLSLYLILKIHLYLQLGIVLLLFTLSFYLEIPFALDNAFNSLIFVFIGYYFFQSMKGNSEQVKKLIFLGSIVIISITLYFYHLPILDLANKVYGSPVINIAWAISIIILFIYTLKKIALPVGFNRVNAYWASNTMIIFIIHPYTNNIAYLFSSRYFESNWVVTFGISMLCLIVLVLLKIWFEEKKGFKFYV